MITCIAQLKPSQSNFGAASVTRWPRSSQSLGRGFRTGDAIGMGWQARGWLGAERDPQLARRRRDLLQERPRRRRRPIGIARRRPARRIEEGRSIAHAPAHHMAAGQAAPAFAHIGTGRISVRASA